MSKKFIKEVLLLLVGAVLGTVGSFLFLSSVVADIEAKSYKTKSVYVDQWGNMYDYNKKDK